jgi:hypothetical protein
MTLRRENRMKKYQPAVRPNPWRQASRMDMKREGKKAISSKMEMPCL